MLNRVNGATVSHILPQPNFSVYQDGNKSKQKPCRRSFLVAGLSDISLHVSLLGVKYYIDIQCSL